MPKTVVVWCGRLALPQPRRLMAWMRLLLAAQLVEDAGRGMAGAARAAAARGCGRALPPRGRVVRRHLRRLQRRAPAAARGGVAGTRRGRARHDADEALLRRYADDATDDGGEAFLEIYVRHRSAVRRELEARGLSPEQAEQRLGGVFILALNAPDAAPDAPSLRERLLERAREAAADLHWRPPG